MEQTEYQQYLIDMENIIFEFYSGLFGARERFNSYEEKTPKDLPEKIEMHPLLQLLRDAKDEYNKNIENSDSRLENIYLKDYTTFEEIVKRLDENENISMNCVVDQDLTLDKTEIKQYHKDIDAAQNIGHSWHELILRQKNKII